MLTEAIEKLKSEMDGNKANSYVQVVGGFLLQHLERSPQDAEKVIDKDKTIAKSLDAMKNEAQKKKSGNCAVLTDQEGFTIVLKYFGIDKKPTIQQEDVIPIKQPDSARPETKMIDFDISLDDLLAGG